MSLSPKLITLSTVVLLLAAGQVDAGIRASFGVDNCSWTATHIVVIDEAGSVLESLKGDLSQGYRIPLEQLKMPTLQEMDEALQGHFEPKARPSNKRRILFLIKENSKWKPAAREMNISMAWQEKEALYGFKQMFNPGPLCLVVLEEKEKRFYQIIKESVKLQEKLQATKHITDSAKRARALTEFIVPPGNHHCRREPLNELGRCGEAAGKVILEFLDDETKSHNTFHADLIKVYAGTFREKARPRLMREVVDGLAYWKKLAPRLTQDWWTKQSARDHSSYSRLYCSLYLLGDIGVTEKDREPIQSLIDFWKSVPVLESMGVRYRDGQRVTESQIVETARRCLKQISSP